jgi:hypothetical protein
MEEGLDVQPVLRPHDLAQLVGLVYATAPAAVQCSLLAHLMRPLGVLALLPVGNGVFARIRLQNGRPDASMGLEYLHEVCTADVIALTDCVLQRSEDVMIGLSQLLHVSAVAYSEAVAEQLQLLSNLTRHLSALD